VGKAIIAIDAGGTKTKAALINENCQIIERISGPAGSPAVVTTKTAFANVFALTEKLYRRYYQQYKIVFIQLGISGLGIVADPLPYQKKLAELLQTDVAVDDDGYLALHSLMKTESGNWIAVISGTGSCCYGTNGNKTMMLGGFGHLLTEAGSAYAAVKSVVTAAIRQFEEKEPLSPLSKAFMHKVGARNVYQFKVFIFNNSKSKIANYAKFIAKRALAGDGESKNILKRCGRDLARWVKLLYKHLSLSDNVKLGFRGSFIDKAPFVKDELISDLTENGFQPSLVSNGVEPIFGAYYLAIRRGKL